MQLYYSEGKTSCATTLISKLPTLGGLMFVCLLLFYGIATVFQLYHGGDMKYETRRRKPEPTDLLTQGIFSLPHLISMIWEELAFDDTVSHTQRGEWITAQLYVIAMIRIHTLSPGSHTPRSNRLS